MKAWGCMVTIILGACLFEALHLNGDEDDGE